MFGVIFRRHMAEDGAHFERHQPHLRHSHQIGGDNRGDHHGFGVPVSTYVKKEPGEEENKQWPKHINRQQRQIDPPLRPGVAIADFGEGIEREADKAEVKRLNIGAVHIILEKIHPQRAKGGDDGGGEKRDCIARAEKAARQPQLTVFLINRQKPHGGHGKAKLRATGKNNDARPDEGIHPIFFHPQPASEKKLHQKADASGQHTNSQSIDGFEPLAREFVEHDLRQKF